MTFPFSVSFNRRLKAPITSENQQGILQFIAQSILDDKADKVAIEGLHVTYKGSTSNWRGSLFGGVDNGIFTLIYKDDTWWLNYQINMRRLFIITGIMSSFAGGFMLTGGGPWWVGIIVFLWLCGGNWVINLLRHGVVATDITAGINELICGKPKELPQEDKMNGKLKSWF